MSTLPSFPAQTYNEIVLKQIRALIAGKALDDVASYKMSDGRELTKIPILELLQWEATFEARVKAERRRKRGLARPVNRITFGGCQ